VSADVVLDRVDPSASEAEDTVPDTGSLIDGELPVDLAWTGEDDLSGIDEYTVQQSTDGGAWKDVGDPVEVDPARLAAAPIAAQAAPASLTVPVAAGHRYRFRVIAADKAGNLATGEAGDELTLAMRQDSSASIRYAGRWTVATSARYLGGKTHTSTARGAEARFSITGRGFAWIATRSRSSGKAGVFVNGNRVATVDLHAAARRDHRLVFTREWSTDRTRTVTIRVLGTNGHARVDLDAIYTWR
jgi:hypothetical protein